MLEMIEPLVLTIPGISVTLGAQIVAEIGDIGRFRSGASVAKYAGLNSGVSQSGKFEAKGSPITKTGSPYPRRAVWLAAESARKFDPKLKAFYEKKRSEGKGHRGRRHSRRPKALSRDLRGHARPSAIRLRQIEPLENIVYALRLEELGSLRPKAFNIRLSKCAFQ